MILNSGLKEVLCMFSYFFEIQNKGFQKDIQAHLRKMLNANSAAPGMSTLDTNTVTVHTSPSMLLNTNKGQG